MTRINCGIPVKQLHNKHLLAEHREIVRVPNHIKKVEGHIDTKSIPKTFCLGTGHVRFFYNKLKYLHNRYKQIRDECYNRGYKVTDFEESFEDLSDNLSYMFLYKDYEPTKDDIEIIQQRINERLKTMK